MYKKFFIDHHKIKNMVTYNVQNKSDKILSQLTLFPDDFSMASLTFP